MSSTRHAADGSPFRQERYCSSPMHQPGLFAFEVAKRCSLLPKAEREVIWTIQRLSWGKGGLVGLAERLIADFPQFIGTKSMHRFGIKPPRY